MPEPAPALSIAGLELTYRGGARALRGINLDIGDGERLALVGESGCGKTSIVRACLGLLAPGAQIHGSVQVAGTEVVGAPGAVLRRLRGLTVGYVPQSPAGALDPLRSVGHHVREAWRAHRQRPPAGAVPALLARLDLPDRAGQYPHQWSGGMLQRATIAAATAHRPVLTIADEPTSALDAELAGGVLEALVEASSALLLVTHDLALATRAGQRVAVCYAGRIVEEGPADRVLGEPRHPYTQALRAAVPVPGGGLPSPLPGVPPPAWAPDAGCAFAPRCPRAVSSCRVEVPTLEDGVACPRI
ncbi:MAG TPA: ABC transporter ATP-binding protein [Actinomycetota bacterium]|nr:ABC transporter ATP-binding protein [Actinomycetota bacterium]